MKDFSRLFLFLSLFCASCRPEFVPPPSPTQDTGFLLTQVAFATRLATIETLFAQLTLHAAATETQTATLTATASISTETPVYEQTLSPTISPSPVESLTPSPTHTRTITVTPSPQPYQCVVVSQFPENGVSLRTWEDFDMHWVVYNTGTATWDTSNVDYRYLSGEKMSKRRDAFDLQREVEPGTQTEIVVDMVAPGLPGRYTTTWGVVYGTHVACQMNLTLNTY